MPCCYIITTCLHVVIIIIIIIIMIIITIIDLKCLLKVGNELLNCPKLIN